jgi:hypothetical protein
MEFGRNAAEDLVAVVSRPVQLRRATAQHALDGERVHGHLDAALRGRLLDPDTRTGPSTETMKVIHGEGRPRWSPAGIPLAL